MTQLRIADRPPKQLTSRWQLYLRNEWQSHRTNLHALPVPLQTLTLSQFTKQAAERYKRLSIEEQEALEDELLTERGRYQADLATYKELVSQEEGEAVEEPRSASTRSKKGKEPAADAQPKPERAKTGYLIFLDEQRALDPNVKDLKTLSQSWKILTEEEREGYRDKAKPDQERYQQERALHDARQKELNAFKPKRRRKTDAS